MLVLFTDFGLAGPYVGQMKAVLHRDAPGQAIVDLMADAPRFAPRPAAYLLAAYAAAFPRDSVFLCVVDPGVGSSRHPLAMQAADGQWFVGPDNGLLAIVARRSGAATTCWRITWAPEQLSASFHGRDLFAPVAARLALGETPSGDPLATTDLTGADWPDDLAEIVYLDSYGNAMTGLRASRLAPDARLVAGDRDLARARTFSDVAPGAAFWYENANGLAEIAVNQGSAAAELGLSIGSILKVV